MLLVLCGCAGYRLGPTSGTVAGERSIHVEVFSNDTLQPRLGDSATQALRRSLQRDGTYRLGGSRDADVIVQGNVKEYARQGLSYDPRDAITVQDYNLAMMVHVVARERATGKVILDQDVGGHTQVRSGQDLNSAERQAAPLLAQDFAKKTTSLLVDGSW